MSEYLSEPAPKPKATSAGWVVSLSLFGLVLFGLIKVYKK